MDFLKPEGLIEKMDSLKPDGIKMDFLKPEVLSWKGSRHSLRAGNNTFW